MSTRAIVAAVGLISSMSVAACAQGAPPVERHAPDGSRLAGSAADSCSTPWRGKDAQARFLGAIHGVEELVSGGIVDMVATESGDLYFRTVIPFGLWHVNPAGAMRRLASVDPMASALGGGFSGPFLHESGALLLWHDASSTRIMIAPDDRVLDVQKLPGIAKLAGKPFALSLTGIAHTQRDSVSGQTMVLRGGGPAVDTVRVARTLAEQRRSCINDGFATVCQIIPFQPVLRWAAGGTDRLVWSDGSTPSLLMAPDGGQGRTFACLASAGRAVVSEDERANESELITWANRSNDPAWAGPVPVIPETKPAVERLAFDQTGRLWVVHPIASERLPANKQRPFFPDATSPARRWRARWELLVFSDRGVALARLPLPAGVGPGDWAAGGGIMWALQVDSSGSGMELVRYAIPDLTD